MYKTEQESFWAGSFGNEYVARCSDDENIARRTGQWSKMIAPMQSVSSVLELGANVGQNLLAIRRLLPTVKMDAVEINETAIEQLRKIPDVSIHEGSILDYSHESLGSYDLTFTCGVLIHISPDMLEHVYELLYACSKKYILVNEYYNPTPVEVNYRGNAERLFKRDFAGEIMAAYPDLELVDYGFHYHRDIHFPADDSTWFLMRKRG